MNWESDLRSQLEALGEAEETDPPRALQLRVALVESRLVDRLQGAVHGATELDVALLFRLGRDLEVRGFHEEALVALSAARAHAAATRDARWSERIAVHGALSSIALIDLPAAEAVLRELLDLGPDVPLSNANVNASVLRLDRRNHESDHRHPVAIEALYAVGRLLAAQGDLQCARQLLTTALDRAHGNPSPWISLPDLALFLAEVALDLGDFATAAGFADEWSTRVAQRHTRLGWQVLRGTLHYGRGELSEADRCFGLVAREPITPEVERPLRSALWQRAQVLTLLNRLDEAEDVVRNLDSSGAEEGEALRSLIETRRGHSASLRSPPSPKEVLAFPVGRELPPPPGAGAVSAAPSAVRSQERVRDEWARRSNAVLVACQDGDHDSALRQFALLAAWTPGLSSPLIQARYAHLKAVVAYFLGHFADAEASARAAVDAFRSLSLVVDEWGATRVLFWSLRQRGAPEEELAPVAMQSRLMLKALEERLTPTDRVFHRLNKWSAIDDAISRWTGQLRTAQQDGIRQEAAVTSTLHRITIIKSWDALLDNTQTDRAKDDQAPPGMDVFSWARERLGARRRLRGIAGYGLPFVTRWIPKDVAVIHHVVLPERLEAFLVQRSGVTLLDLPEPTSRVRLMELVKGTLRELYREKLWDSRSPALADLAHALGMKAVSQALGSDVRRLVFAPDDTIAHVPFAALPVNGVPLVTRFEPCVLPHHRWTGRDAARRVRFENGLAVAVSRSDAAPKYTALGDPVDEIEGLASVTRRGVTVLRDRDATCERVLRELPGVRVAHFACHGEFQFTDPMDTGLLMHDRWFTLRDLRHLDLSKVEIVVAGACFGADMAVLPGRELVGLPAALVEAGVGAVVAPLWELFEDSSVSAAATNPAADFFRAWYAEIPRLGPAAALASVQRAWANARSTSDWAGYQIFVGGIVPPAPVRWLLPLLELWSRATARSARVR